MSSRAQLFVGRLPIDVREREIEQVFEKYGRLLRCDVKYGMFGATGRRGGGRTGMAYAFVDYDDRRDAEDAIKYENGREIRRHSIVVEWARGPSYRQGSDRSSYPRSGGGGGGGRNAQSYSRPSRSSEECYRCRRPGHWARDCPELERDRSYYGRRYHSRSRSGSRSHRRKQSYSRSRSRDRHRSNVSDNRHKSHSGSRERHAKPRSPSRSVSKSYSRSRSRSPAKEKRRKSDKTSKKSKEMTASKSPSRSRSPSKSHSRSPRFSKAGRSTERSPLPQDNYNNKRGGEDEERRSMSRSPRKSMSRTPSRSPSKERDRESMGDRSERSVSRSKSR